MNLNYFDNKNILKTFYESAGLVNRFEKDCIFLETAFNEIEQLWQDNFDQIETVKYIMISEAPLWGEWKKYIYNPDTINSQFFYRSDLGDIVDNPIKDKMDFIKVCNEIGLIILDISPFPLNTVDTAINYSQTCSNSRKLTTNEYRKLVVSTIPTYFERKIKIIKDRKSANIKIFYRYARVKNTFQDIISNVLIKNEFVKHMNDIEDISQKGGGIDKVKLEQIIKDRIK